MSKWESIKEEDKKNMVEVKIKIPKKCVAFIINYIEHLKDGSFSLGNMQFGTDEIEKLMENEDVRNTD